MKRISFPDSDASRFRLLSFAQRETLNVKPETQDQDASDASRDEDDLPEEPGKRHQEVRQERGGQHVVRFPRKLRGPDIPLVS